eukprot:m.48673 g.48673  ORF g.48673 m.48673 type:complete len:871 (+) comp20817_c0_seq1:235-2847(+)
MADEPPATEVPKVEVDVVVAEVSSTEAEVQPPPTKEPEKQPSVAIVIEEGADDGPATTSSVPPVSNLSEEEIVTSSEKDNHVENDPIAEPRESTDGAGLDDAQTNVIDEDANVDRRESTDMHDGSLHAIVGHALSTLEKQEAKLVAMTTTTPETSNDSIPPVPSILIETMKPTTPHEDTLTPSQQDQDQEQPTEGGDAPVVEVEQVAEVVNDGGDTEATLQTEEPLIKESNNEAEASQAQDVVPDSEDGVTEDGVTEVSTDTSANTPATTAEEQMQVVNLARIEVMKLATSLGMIASEDFTNFIAAVKAWEDAKVDPAAASTLEAAEQAYDEVCQSLDFARQELLELLDVPVDLMNDTDVQSLRDLFIEVTKASEVGDEFSIPVDHFSQVLEQASMPLTDDLKLMLAKADVNGDGEINLKEFLDGMQNDALLRMAKQTAILGKKVFQARASLQFGLDNKDEHDHEDANEPIEALTKAVDSTERKLLVVLSAWADEAKVSPQGFTTLQQDLGVFEKNFSFHSNPSPHPVDPMEEKRLKKEMVEKLRTARARKETLIQENTTMDSHIAQMLNMKLQKDGKEQTVSKTFKNVADQETRYYSLLGSIRQEEMLIAVQKQQSTDLLEKMTAKTGVAREKVESLREEFTTTKAKYCDKAVSGLTGKKPPDHVFATYQATLEKKELSVTEERLRFIKFKNGVLKLESVLMAKEKLGDGLHFIDFEQLKIENQSCHEKIEERNEEITKLKTKITTAVQVLSHMKEKLDFVEMANKQRRTQVHRIEQELANKRDIVSRQKRVREKVRTDNLGLHVKCGLLGQTNLLRDYEVGFDQHEEHIKAIEDLKTKHAEVESKATNYKLRLLQLQRQRGGPMGVTN